MRSAGAAEITQRLAGNRSRRVVPRNDARAVPSVTYLAGTFSLRSISAGDAIHGALGGAAFHSSASLRTRRSGSRVPRASFSASLAALYKRERGNRRRAFRVRTVRPLAREPHPFGQVSSRRRRRRPRHRHGRSTTSAASVFASGTVCFATKHSARNADRAATSVPASSPPRQPRPAEPPSRPCRLVHPCRPCRPCQPCRPSRPCQPSRAGRLASRAALAKCRGTVRRRRRRRIPPSRRSRSNATVASRLVSLFYKISSET